MHIFMVEQIVIKTNNFENDYLINYHVFFMFLSYLYVLSRIDFATFYYFSIEFRNCSDNDVFVVFVPTMTYLLFLFRQWRICCFCSDNVVFVVFVPTMWYLLFLFWQCRICCFCSDKVVFVVFVLTMWYLFLFRQCGICSDRLPVSNQPDHCIVRPPVIYGF